MINWIKSLFGFKPKRPFPTDEQFEKLYQEAKMRNNPMYQEDCAIAAFNTDLKALGATHDDFRRWLEKRGYA